MKPEEKDRAYLWDILTAAQDISDFASGLSFQEFESDKKCRFAVERQLLVIGEATHHLSEDMTAAHPQVPWRHMVGLRNIIAHDYGEVLIDRVWAVVQKNIPELIRDIGQILK